MTSRTATKRRAATVAPPPRRTPVVLAALGALAVVVAIGLAIALGGGDDGEPDSDALTFAPVIVEDQALPTFTDGATDPAIGLVAPLVEGVAPDGSPTSVGGAGEPTLVAFLAHWCPHCQAELPILVDLAGDDRLDGVRMVVVLTGTNGDAPNFPPAAWLDREGWTGEVLVDDEGFTAAGAFGLEGYPFLVALDADGQVVGRTSGEQPAEQLIALADAARGGS